MFLSNGLSNYCYRGFHRTSTMMTVVDLVVLVALAIAMCAFAEEGSDHLKCRTVFHDYTSSPLEQKWVDNVETWQLDVCKHITNNEMNWWLGNVSSLLADNDASAVISASAKPPTTTWSYVFSVFTYKKTCMHKTTGTSTIEYVHVPIEPTAAIARDPRKCWEPMTEKYTQSKEYLLPLSFKGATHSAVKSYNPAKTPQQQNISIYLFDAGATLPGKDSKRDNQWSGTEWIYGWYAKRGIVFDHVYAWEPRAGDIDMSVLEPGLAKALKFFKVGISDGPTHQHNPLARIRALCKPKDIVVFKLDIDNLMEMNVVKQLLSDPELLGLVDEFYYEHHVKNNLMRMHGLGGNDKKSNLKTWYDMVMPARRRGLHMHFWP